MSTHKPHNDTILLPDLFVRLSCIGTRKPHNDTTLYRTLSFVCQSSISTHKPHKDTILYWTYHHFVLKKYPTPTDNNYTNTTQIDHNTTNCSTTLTWSWTMPMSYPPPYPNRQYLHQHWGDGVAQLVERRPWDPEVRIPSGAQEKFVRIFPSQNVVLTRRCAPPPCVYARIRTYTR